MLKDGSLIWQISCDESGTGGMPYYGFGTLWMSWQRRGDFFRHVEELATRHRYPGEIKWQKANNARFRKLYLELVDYFFQTKWLSFHALIVRKANVKKHLHEGDYDLARRKHFTKMLSTKIRDCIRAHPNRECSFRIVVDPIASRYEKADEVVQIIANNQIEQMSKVKGPIETLLQRDSKQSAQIQLCDFLLGAVMEAWQKEASSRLKKDIQKHIATYLGWPNLEADTMPRERKFNIWYFYDPTLGAREIKTRKVNLIVPFQIP